MTKTKGLTIPTTRIMVDEIAYYLDNAIGRFRNIYDNEHKRLNLTVGDLIRILDEVAKRENIDVHTMWLTWEWGYDDSGQIIIKYERPETDEEFAKRVKSVERAIARKVSKDMKVKECTAALSKEKRQAEREQYERLHAIYGKKG